jgi:hypothetical protein
MLALGSWSESCVAVLVSFGTELNRLMQMLVRGVLKINASGPKPVYTVTFEPRVSHETGQSPPRQTREGFAEAEK